MHHVMNSCDSSTPNSKSMYSGLADKSRKQVPIVMGVAVTGMQNDAHCMHG